MGWGKKKLKQFSMGKHLLLEVYDVKYDILNDKESLLNAMICGIEAAKMHILNVFTYNFEPQGVTIVIALSESHVSCHTWPEKGSTAIDVYTCGPGNPNLIANNIISYLKSDNFELREIER